jgi:hypothetical protein
LRAGPAPLTLDPLACPMPPTADEMIRARRVRTPTSAMVDNVSRLYAIIDVVKAVDLSEEIVLP